MNEGKKTLFNVDKKGNITGGALEARRGSGSTDVVARFGSEIEKDENISVSQTEIIMNRKSGSGSQLKIATRMENGGKWDQNNSNSGGIVLAPDNKIAVKVDNSGKVGIGKENPIDLLDVAPFGYIRGKYKTHENDTGKTALGLKIAAENGGYYLLNFKNGLLIKYEYIAHE